MKEKYTEDRDNLIIDEILVFLQEKRIALAMVRIGITIIFELYNYERPHQISLLFIFIEKNHI
ncbi:hypothetical protein [Desulfobacterium sp. N47]